MPGGSEAIRVKDAWAGARLKASSKPYTSGDCEAVPCREGGACTDGGVAVEAGPSGSGTHACRGLAGVVLSERRDPSMCCSNSCVVYTCVCVSVFVAGMTYLSV